MDRKVEVANSREDEIFSFCSRFLFDVCNGQIIIACGSYWIGRFIMTVQAQRSPLDSFEVADIPIEYCT